jgi:enolase
MMSESMGEIMNNHIKETLELKAQEIISETTKYKFPFFSSTDEKKKIIFTKKEQIDNLFDELLSKYELSSKQDLYWEKEMWNEVQANAVKKFSSLPDCVKINSFFLQELMHEYAEKKALWILNQFS